VLYELFPAAVAVIVHKPAAFAKPVAVVVPPEVEVPVMVHGPAAGAVKLTVRPAEDDALTKNVFAYCTFGNGGNVMVCCCVLELCELIVNDPDTGVAAS
jgi:hypothetical protein